LIFSHVRTRYTYNYQTSYYNPWTTLTYLIIHKYDVENTFHFLDLKDKVGFKFKRLCFFGGFYISYFISGRYNQENVNGPDDYSSNIRIKNHLRYGAEFEINYYLWKRYWFIGIGSSITNNLVSSPPSIFKKYLILSFQFTIGAKFLKDTYFK
jgi:hypothetical protein